MCCKVCRTPRTGGEDPTLVWQVRTEYIVEIYFVMSKKKKKDLQVGRWERGGGEDGLSRGGVGGN